ncbi:MAG: hypothetical protein KBS95_00130 [Alistipes sp.]|nr:hypothetical protein [Candidatus Alistipes equi]
MSTILKTIIDVDTFTALCEVNNSITSTSWLKECLDFVEMSLLQEHDNEK